MKPPKRIVAVVPDKERSPRPIVRVYEAGDQGAYTTQLRAEKRGFTVYVAEVDWEEFQHVSE